jgi:hypothetical protein
MRDRYDYPPTEQVQRLLEMIFDRGRDLTISQAASAAQYLVQFTHEGYVDPATR